MLSLETRTFNMSEQKQNRLGFKNSAVLTLAQRGNSPDLISQETGMSRKEVYRRVSQLRNGLGYLPKLTPEERQLRKRSVLSWIEPYARMGMFALEIAEALKLDGKKELSQHKIQTSILNGRRTKALPRPTKEEISDVISDSKKPEEETRKRTGEWVALRDRLKAENADMPEGRLEWKKELTIEKARLETMAEVAGKKFLNLNPLDQSYLIAFYKIRMKAKQTGDLRVLKEFPRHFVQQDPSITKRLSAFREEIMQLTKLSLDVDVRKALVEHGEMTLGEVMG